MKGIVFTEFLEMVEQRFSPEIADRLIDESDLPSGGIYTAVGTYEHTEIVTYVSRDDFPSVSAIFPSGQQHDAQIWRDWPWFGNLYPAC